MTTNCPGIVKAIEDKDFRTHIVIHWTNKSVSEISLQLLSSVQVMLVKFRFPPADFLFKEAEFVSNNLNHMFIVCVRFVFGSKHVQFHAI